MIFAGVHHIVVTLIFHSNIILLCNFQLNLALLWNHEGSAGGAGKGKKITDFSSYERVLKGLSHQAEQRKIWAVATGYLRIAEFLMDRTRRKASMSMTRSKDCSMLIFPPFHSSGRP